MEEKKSKEDLEKEKLDNEIKLQHFEIESEKRKLKLKGWPKKIKDFSEGLKSWGQIIATLFLGVVGLYFTKAANRQQESNTNATNTQQRLNQRILSATQQMSDREKSETDFRREMYQPMINQILSDSINDEKHLKKRIEIFKVFQNNFHDLFNCRSLYDVLDDAIRNMTDTNTTHKKELLNELITLARHTNEDEERLIEVGGNSIILDNLKEGETKDSSIGEIKGDTTGHKFHIKIVSINNNDSDFVSIKLTLINEDSKDSIVLNNGEPFYVQYYDSPLTDNILLPDKDRISVTLEDIYPHKKQKDAIKMARLKIIHFPGDYITTGYRPSVSAIQDMLKPK